MKKQAYTLFSLLLLVTSIALSGCSGDKNDNKQNGKTPSSDNMSQEPTYGGDVVVGIQQDLDSLDPHKAVAAGTSEVLFNIFEGLVKPNENGDLVPTVASDYTISDDGTVYTFVLRDGIKFHSGNLVTVEDIVYSVKRSAGLLKDKDASINVKSALSNIKDVTATDNKTVKITLKTPDTELLAYLTTAIIPANYDGQETKPIGTGPFKFVSFSHQQSLVMEKNPDYWGEKPYLDKVTFKIVEKADIAMMELQGGTIDIFPYLTNDQANQIKDKFNVKVGNMNMVQGLFLNNAKAPFNNPKVREALNYAVNRQEILDFVAGGNGTVIQSAVFPGFTKFYNKSLSTYYSQDVEKAKALLTEAGYAKGLSFTIKVPSGYQYHIDTAQVIVDQLAKIGVTAKIQTVEWNSWLSDVYNNRNYEATVIGLVAPLAARELLGRYDSKATNNFVNYTNSEYDKILKEALVTTDDTTKVENYKELQRILTEDSVSVYLADPSLMVGINKKLSGYTFYPVYVQDMSKVYYVKE